MKYYRAHGRVVGSKYIGVVAAENEEEGREAAFKHDNSYASLCHQCSDECEDPEVDEIFLEEITEAEYQEESK